MDSRVSIAIETSCGLGGVALGVGDELVGRSDFDASSRHGAELVSRLAELLRSAGLRPADVEEVYVSVGPGSFTGTRIGVTVARTLGGMVPSLRCVAVPSPAAVAEGARGLAWERLGVVLDARGGLIHVTVFARRGPGARIARAEDGRVMRPADFLAAAAPIALLGEGLAYHDLRADGVTILRPDRLDRPPHLPDAEGVWRVGRRLADAGEVTGAADLLPIYARPPEALRLWQEKAGR